MAQRLPRRGAGGRIHLLLPVYRNFVKSGNYRCEQVISPSAFAVAAELLALRRTRPG